MHTKGEWWTWVKRFASLQFGYACMIGVEADNKQPRVSMCSSAEGEVLSRGEPAGGIREAGHFLCLGSIVRRVPALKKGLIWRVGDGTQIDIWSDPWIPDGLTRRPITL